MVNDQLPTGTSDSSDQLPPVRLGDLGELVRTKRRSERLTLEQAANQIGVSAPTLSRLERQATQQSNSGKRNYPEMRTLSAITRWLGVSLQDHDNDVTQSNASNRDMPTFVAAHLRADPKLNPRTAEVLSNIFRAAYEQFATEENLEESVSETEGSSTNPTE